jgi:hypothetical protein
LNFDNVPIISFNDENGTVFPVRDIKPFADLQSGKIIEVNSKMDLDELASRKEIYGDDTEGLTYLIVEKNAEILIENDFDLNRVKKLDIPIVESE